MVIINRILQNIYKGIWIVLFFIRNNIYTFLLRFLFYINNVKYGTNVKTYGAVPMLRINRKAGAVRIGNNCVFNNYNDVGWYSKCSIWVRRDAVLTIGDNSGFNGVLLYTAKKIEIGNHVKVGGGTKIFDTDFHPINFELRRYTLDKTKTASVKIEDDVFIGTNCIICKGVSIGSRSIVAAGSVVTRSIPSDEIWGGNPAKKIKNIIYVS